VPPTIPPPTASEVFVGAGDIAMCDALEPARQTGQLLRTIGGTVFTLGDNAYFSGSAREYRDCYDPTWGSERGRTRPVPGNHEYDGASAAYRTSRTSARRLAAGLGYYSYEVGAWHVIALNSNLSPTESSPQGVWLRNDLAASRAKCTLAYWHHPLFTSSQNGPQNFTRDFWRQLYAAGADVILRRPRSHLRTLCPPGSRRPSRPDPRHPRVRRRHRRRHALPVPDHGGQQPGPRARLRPPEAHAHSESYD
jgi:hypothetical protein